MKEEGMSMDDRSKGSPTAVRTEAERLKPARRSITSEGDKVMALSKEKLYAELTLGLRAQPVGATPSDRDHLFLRGGVHEIGKKVWSFCIAEGRDMAPLEGGRIVA
jgi:hypothetical protein